MKIMMKFLLRNIREKKFRTFLILLSITLSTALFFASIGMSDNIAKMYLKEIQKTLGSAEIIIYADKDSPSNYFRTSQAEKYMEQLEYMIGNTSERGIFEYSPQEKIVFSLQGYELEDLQKMNPITIEQEYHLYPFNGKKLIIDRATAEKYKLELGNPIEIKVEEEKFRFIIAGIASTGGLLTPSDQSATTVMPLETANNLFGEKGRVSTLYLKTKDSSLIQKVLDDLSRSYKRYVVERTITEKDIEQYTSMISKPFMLMLVLVVFISVFVIYTSFKVISMERMPLIGTFRSIGATKKMTDFLLLAESILYGIVGGILGCGLGYLILYGMIHVMASDPYQSTKMEVELAITFGQLMISFLGAVLLSFGSSAVPILVVSKVSVRDIVLNTYENKKGNKNKSMMIGFLLFFLASTIPLVVPREIALLVNSICLILISMALVLFIPFITEKCIGLLEKIYRYLFGNIGIIAVKNLRDNKGVLNNIALLSIGIASLLMINTLSYSVGIEVLNVYNEGKFDILLNHPKGNKDVEQRLRGVKGVSATYGLYEVRNVKVAGTKEEISSVYGIDPNKFFDNWDFEFVGKRTEVLDKFDGSRNVILSSSLKNKLELKEGDMLTLETERGNKDYRVIGFVDTLMQNGNVALVPERYLKQDMKLRYYSDLYVKTHEDPEGVLQRIKEKFKRDQLFGMTLNEMERSNMESNAQIFVLLKGFSFMTMVIGVFGVLNNFVVNFLSRRRSLAVMRSVGMSKKQTTKMLFIEALTGGLIGGITGAFGGLCFILLMPFILTAMDLPIQMHYVPSMFINAMVSGVIITVISSVSPSFKSTKLNIIESIKYE
ncbi:putative ABC transport system permease protein [Anaerosolibacter carboniphilus]|uniref:Putative ABC transport system permease protein n=1 Tax=Anaerosolibacter carboniphilus TaxID=1417629 RepID=A0A841KTI2_9FIRM|nr:FtsX-like permease family protein [Anaerosolibacter carboniphilus]MBB6216727.1 putative ABC transport system permease protein [Anaerosolibacter carboniphilus]